MNLALENAFCQYLDWDSEFFSVRIGRITVNRLTEVILEQVLMWCKFNSIDCLYFLANTDDVRTVRLVEEHDFRCVDIRITLERQIDDFPEAEEGIAQSVVHLCTPMDVQALRAIARVSHHDSRFYHDSIFPISRCDALYETWIEKSCSGYADAVMVAEMDGEPVGYLSCHLLGQSKGQIGLFGIKADLQERGLGRRLIDESLRWFRMQDRKEVTVVTQGRNINAQRLYQKCGFLTRSVQLWYHRWFRTM
jgi:dTDP-4-amino-4,6-dideoxy-D-galactose acyltransferase